MRKCKKCSGDIPSTRRASALYCSSACGGNQTKPKAKVNVDCLKCGEPVPSHRPSTAKYCSDVCKKSVEFAKWYDKKRQLHSRVHSHCIRCGERIEDYKKLDAMYCSKNKCKKRQNSSTGSTNRDGRLRSNSGYLPFGAAEWEKLKRRFEYRCAYCGERKELTKDHVVPLSRGGRHAIANIVPACKSCNSSKKDKLLIEWQRVLGTKPSFALRIGTAKHGTY